MRNMMATYELMGLECHLMWGL